MNFDRNTIAAFVLAIAVLVAWEVFLAPKAAQKPPIVAGAPVEAGAAATSPAAPPAALENAVTVAPPEATPAAPEKRIRISTASINGSLSLTGVRIDDLSLIKFREQLDPASPEIVLLSPATSARPYYAELGWITSDAGVAVPSGTTEWTAENPNAAMTETTPVVLTWDNGQGLKFKRVISVDPDYLFTIEQSVENSGEKPVTLFPYGLIARIGGVDHSTTYLLHEGPLGVFERTLKEVNYDDLKKSKTGRDQVDATAGWIGITDKYWLAALAFDPAQKIAASFNYAAVGDKDRYQTDLRAGAVNVAPGESKAVKSFLFAGAKELQLLDGYSEKVGIPRFDLAIDFGWFYFLTKPFFYALRWLHEALGNFGLAIIAFSTFVRLLMFPIANRQYRSMNNMKRVQPELKRLQERYASDRTRLNQEMMELYKREKINPLGGCLPVFIQIPVFFALYKVLFVSIEMRHAPFYGWIHDLSAADPTGLLNLFGLVPYTVPSILTFFNIGAWPLIYGVTMFFQQRLTPQVGDPVTQKMMTYMPLIFTFVLASMPAGLVIYWAWGNLLAILQQSILLRTPTAKAGAKA